jgi:hypothetical protein
MSGEISLPHQTTRGAAQRVGQGTEIEKSRAQSEVYFRLAYAHENPRDIEAARTEMRQECASMHLAEQAFYSVPKGGGSNANGPSVHLARELARIWGNVDYGVVELRRDDEHGQSEMQAFAWDLQTNTRPSSLWIQPHKMDTRRGVKHLTEVNAIYESNANAGARRVREAIFNVLPKSFVQEAQDLCRATLARGNGEPLAERIEKAVGAFSSTFGVTEQQLVDRIGRATSRWDEQDVADLLVLFKSLKAGEVQKDVEFPVRTVTADEITAQAKGQKATAQPAPDQEAAGQG